MKVGSYLPVTLGGRGSAWGCATSSVDDLLAFTRAFEEIVRAGK